MTYEGWANYHTWSVALSIGNDQFLYNLARNYSQEVKDRATYEDFVCRIMPGEYGSLAPDGVSWTDPTLDNEALDRMIKELGE